MSHIPNHKNYIFIYFEMPLKKMIYLHFSSSLSSKLTLVTNHNCICNYKPLFTCFYNYMLFLPWCHKDSCINSRKNGWFGHKSQMCGLVWTKIPCSASWSWWDPRIDGNMHWTWKLWHQLGFWATYVRSKFVPIMCCRVGNYS
jgi:hypothetical protein